MNMPVTVPSCEDTYKGDEHHSAVAKTVDEARGLIKAGFEYVCDIEGVKLFRKRK